MVYGASIMFSFNSCRKYTNSYVSAFSWNIDSVVMDSKHYHAFKPLSHTFAT